MNAGACKSTIPSETKLEELDLPLLLQMRLELLGIRTVGQLRVLVQMDDQMRAVIVRTLLQVNRDVENWRARLN